MGLHSAFQGWRYALLPLAFVFLILIVMVLVEIFGGASK